MANLNSSTTIPSSNGASPTQLLAIQGFLGGFILAMLFAVANTLFLKDYGTEWFPLMYIFSAIAIPIVTVIYKQVSDRTSVSNLLVGTSGSLFVVYLVVWALTVFAGQMWMSFALMVFFGVAFIYQLITIPVQASYLFDLRQIKTQMPILLASQVAALIVSGLLIGLLTSLLGGVANLLLICMILSGVQAFVTWYTVRKFSDALTKSTTSLTKKSEATWGEAMGNRFSRYIFFYRFFSFFGTEMVVLLLATFAVRLFQTEQALASFFGNIMAIGTFLTLLFLILLAGRLLKRYGLGFGLLINPVVVVIPIVVIAILSMFGSVSDSMVLGVVIVARIADFVLSAGASNPSIQTMFQALPERIRPIVVTASESLVLPLAYASVGLSLYLFRWLNIYTDFVIVVYSVVICFLWTWFSFLTYRLYVSALLEKLQRRGIGEAELTFDDPQSRAVIMQLVEGDNLQTAQMALDLLKGSEHEVYKTAVISRLTSPNESAQLDALQRLETLPAHANHKQVQELATHASNPTIRAAALTTYTASGTETAIAAATAALQDRNHQVRHGALVGLLKYGGLPGQVAAAQQLIHLAKSQALTDNLLLAETLAQAGRHNYFQPIITLLDNKSTRVQIEALKAVHNAPNPILIPKVVALLANPKTRSAAADALAIYGTALRPEIADGLASPTVAHARLVQLSGTLVNDEQVELGVATDLLIPHLQHPSTMMREAVRNALYRSNYQPQTPETQQYVEDAIAEEVNYVGTLFGLKEAIDTHIESFPKLSPALNAEIEQVAMDLLNLMSLEIGGRSLRHLARTIQSGDSNTVAEAIEGIDVLLTTKRKRIVLPLIDSALTFKKRFSVLQKQIDIPEFSLDTALQQVYANPANRYADYTQAAAIYDFAQERDNKALNVQVFANPPIGSVTEETLRWTKTASGEQTMIAIEKIAVLKQTDILGSVPEDALVAVAQIAEVLELPANRTFINEGDAAEEMFVIVNGRVQAQKNGRSIVELTEGDTVGELAIFDAQPRASDVVTLMPTTLLVIAQDTLRDVMLDRPEINDGIIRTLVQRIRVQGVNATSPEPNPSVTHANIQQEKPLVKPKDSFTAQSFLVRVFDPHFKKQQAYATSLVATVPDENITKTLIDLFYKRSEISDGRVLDLVSNAMFDRMRESQIADYLAVVSADLNRLTDLKQIRLAFQMLRPTHWTRLQEDARVRVEHMLIHSIAEGQAHPDGAFVGENGWFGTWTNRFIDQFTLKQVLATELIKKLSDSRLHKQYVLIFMGQKLPELARSDDDKNRVIKALVEAINNDSDTVVLDWLKTNIASFPPEWEDQLQRQLPNFGLPTWANMQLSS